MNGLNSEWHRFLSKSDFMVMFRVSLDGTFSKSDNSEVLLVPSFQMTEYFFVKIFSLITAP